MEEVNKGTLRDQCDKHGFSYRDFFYYRNIGKIKPEHYYVQYVGAHKRYVLTSSGIRRMKELDGDTREMPPGKAVFHNYNKEKS